MLFFSKSFIYALIVCIGSFNQGNMCVYPSPTGREIREIHNLDEDSIIWSFYNALTSLCAIFGPMLNEFFFKIFHNSRKKTCFMNALISGIAWFGIILTEVSIWGGMVFRAILGVFVGSFSSLCPMYLVELAPKGHSGSYGTMHQLGVVLAYSILNLLGPSLNYIEMVYFCAAVALLQAALIWICPETCDLEDEAPSESSTMSEIEQKKLFQRKHAAGLIMGFILMFLQQFSGISAFITNLSDMMNNSGLNLHPSYQAGIIQLSQCVASCISSTIVDKIGKKLSWIFSCFGAAFFLLLYSLNSIYEWASIIPLIAVFMYEFSFGIGIGPIPWFIVPEYFPFKVRSKATGVCTAFNWLCSFAVIFIWPLMNHNLGDAYSFLIFMAVCIVGIIYGFFGLGNTEPSFESSSIEPSVPLTVSLI